MPLVDRELLPLLDLLPREAVGKATLAQYRALTGAAAGQECPGVEISRLVATCGEDHGGVPLIVVRPLGAAGPLPCLYHIHGGGFVMGAAANSEAADARLAAELGCVVVSVDYRLAPEFPYPAALDDCYAGLAHICTNAAALQLDAQRIGVIGESAGGGLAAGLALRAQSRGGPKIAFVHLLYPMLDDRTCTAAISPHLGEFVWTRASNAFAWRAYLGDLSGTESVSAEAAPCRASDLSGFPPTFIATGALDLFLEENLAFARALALAAVPLEFHIIPGAFHSFDLVQTARVARSLWAMRLAALRQALAASSSG